MAPDRRVCRYYRLEKLLILCLHPRYWGSILPGANVTATVAVCCLPCLFSWKPRILSLFLYVTVNVTVGVSGFEGREVFFEVIWLCNIQIQHE